MENPAYSDTELAAIAPTAQRKRRAAKSSAKCPAHVRHSMSIASVNLDAIVTGVTPKGTFVA